LSLRCYLQAVRDAIRQEYDLDGNGCEVQPDGRPVPIAGQEFWAVHPGGAGNAGRSYLDERVDLLVTLTVRTGVPPQDRIGVNVMLDENGALAKAEKLRAFLHSNYDVMAAANDLIGAAAAGFAEPLMFKRLTYLGPKGPDWFFADGTDDSTTGVAFELAFGDARRVQGIETAA